MKWAVLVVRTLLGAAFLVFGLNYFFKFLDVPPPTSESAGAYLGALALSGYLTVVKAVEIAGGMLLLSGRWVPLGVTLVTPVAVNILLYELFLLGQPGPGLILTGMAAFLVAGYWPHFRPVFARDAKVVCGC